MGGKKQKTRATKWRPREYGVATPSDDRHNARAAQVLVSRIGFGWALRVGAASGMMSKDDSDRTGAAGAGPAGRRLLKHGLLALLSVDRACRFFILSVDRACRSAYVLSVSRVRHSSSIGPNHGAQEAVWAPEAAASWSLPRFSGPWSSRQVGRKRIASR